ncbi:MAG: hypothetical protein KDC87_14050 [Planctomycetes bacterium]|nr:hypothetical protein [Planctomycetota bacterium]MCB9888801.1 hypothetical protein [Planctomycetota bacterium]
MTTTPYFRGTTAAVCLLFVSSSAFAQGKVGVGDEPSYTFRTSPLQGGGIQSLKDLRGKPVLVDFWGTRCPPCIGFAVPSAIKLAERYGDDLAVVLVECQGSNAEQVASFALRKKWLGNSAMWTTERVFNLGLSGIPHSALISPEGKIVVAGYTSKIHGELEDKIAEYVKAQKSAPVGTPKALKKAWTDFQKGRYGSALDAARKVASTEGNDTAAAKTAIEEFERRLEANLQRATWQIENGHPVDGLARLRKLTKGLESDKNSPFHTRVAALVAKAESNKSEMAAAKAMARIESRLYADGGKPASVKQLKGLASKYEGTQTAARANRIAKWAGSE